MYAIIELKGEQFKVENGSTIYSPLTENKEQDSITIDKVLFINRGEGEEKLIGNPYLEGVKVTATIDKEVKGKKINIFKYKRRKDYQKRIGHRPKFHKITINEISLNSN